MSGPKSGKAGGAKSRSKSAPPLPNLPHHNLAEPYSRLMNLGYGDFAIAYDEVAEILTRQDPRGGAAQLLAMVKDETYYDYDREDYKGGAGGDARAWTRLHALRALDRLGSAAHVAIEPLL